MTLTLEDLQKVKKHWEAKHKTELLWLNFTPEKRSFEWYKTNTATSSPFVKKYYDTLETVH